MEQIDMDKHVFCITAYKDFQQLSALLFRLTRGGGRCYVHIDKRVRIPADFAETWRCQNNVTLIQTQKVFWGSYRHVMAVMDLLQRIEGDYRFVHIISENTLPIVSESEFLAFFSRNPNKSFMEMIPAEQQDPNHVRTRYFYFQHLYNTKGRYGWRIEDMVKKLQDALHIRQDMPLPYKGYLYCHLNRDFVTWILENKEDCLAFLHQIRHVYVPEEYFFQNLIMRSPYADTVVNDALIFDIWDAPERGQPAFLEKRDIPAMKRSGKLFARKFKSDNAADFEEIPQWKDVWGGSSFGDSCGYSGASWTSPMPRRSAGPSPKSNPPR